MNEKELKRKSQKCPSCGGNMAFSPKDKGLKCVFCESVVPLTYDYDVKKHPYDSDAENLVDYKQFTQENKVFKCSNCGANVVLNSLEVAKRCPYCGSGYVAETDEMAGLQPDAIVPFKYSKDESTNLYVKKIKKKWFLPNKFKKAPPVDNISGVYIPCFSFDANTTTKYTGVLATTTTVFVDGKSRTQTTYQNIYGTKKLNLTDIMVESSSHITQEIFDKLKPFSTSEQVVFDSNFILGYSVEHYNQSLAKSKKIANSIMENIIKKQILARYSYTSVVSFTQNTSYTSEMYNYCILPIYQVRYKYKEKDYLTYMNGQTGKLAGKMPKSPVKITFFVLFILALIIGIGLLIYLMD